MRLGVNYKGSKNRIARKIVDQMPPADVFVDLFAGGCSVTHAAMLSGKYKRFIMNDLDGRGIRMFIGEHHVQPSEWISRERFLENKALPIKEQDAFISVNWSYIRNLKDYIYGKEIEPWKKAYHYAVFFQDLSLWADMGFYPEHCPYTDPDERRRFYYRHLIKIQEQRKRWELESAEGLPTFKPFNYTYTTLDYKSVSIPENAVIYCDPPYKGTNCGGYQVIDYPEFYDWCRTQAAPVFISEYEMPLDFAPVAEWGIRQLSNGRGSGKVAMERLYRRI